MVGRILEASKYFNHPDYLDITDGLVFSETAYPKLFNVIKDEDWAKAVLEQELINPNPGNYDYFGFSVDIYEDTAVVGAYGDRSIATTAGSVFVYTRTGNTWTFQQEIHQPTPVVDYRFGYDVAVYKDTLVVGVPEDDTGATAAGSIHIYTRTAGVWSLEQSILNPSPATDNNFGWSVGIHEDTVIVGTPGYSVNVLNGGAIYVYTRTGTTWAVEDLITPSVLAGDLFGSSVSIFGDIIVGGAYADDTGFASSGAAYVYSRSGTTWTLESNLENPVPEQSAFFGYSVAISGDTIVIGAQGASLEGVTLVGAAYVYIRVGTTWILEQRIDNPIPLTYEWFGRAVNIYQDTIIIGSIRNDVGAVPDAGSAYIFNRINGTWYFEKEINNPNPVDGDYFGTDVAVYSDTVIIGAYTADTGALISDGRTYMYRQSLSTTNDNTIKPRETGNPDTKYFIKAK